VLLVLERLRERESKKEKRGDTIDDDNNSNNNNNNIQERNNYNNNNNSNSNDCDNNNDNNSNNLLFCDILISLFPLLSPCFVQFLLKIEEKFEKNGKNSGKTRLVLLLLLLSF